MPRYWEVATIALTNAGRDLITNAVAGVAFTAHPVTGDRCRFESALPDDLEELHVRLG